jgi:hypothetical protein
MENYFLFGKKILNTLWLGQLSASDLRTIFMNTTPNRCNGVQGVPVRKHFCQCFKLSFGGVRHSPKRAWVEVVWMTFERCFTGPKSLHQRVGTRETPSTPVETSISNEKSIAI